MVQTKRSNRFNPNSILIIVFSFLLSSCVNWEDKDVLVAIQTDVNVHIIARDIVTNAPLQNQIINWSIHLYNGSTNTDSNLETGQLITNTNGETTIPTYQCQLTANKIVRISASTPDQTNDMITPVTVSYDDARIVAVNDYAVINLNYSIVK